MAQSEDEYLEAFMHGLEFALLGLTGRLESQRLTRSEREAMTLALEDYRRMLAEYQARGPARPKPFVTEAPIFN
ncbi:MAG: hypothetical protein ACYDCK_10735 [Thermoplasmatota archaeon]